MLPSTGEGTEGERVAKGVGNPAGQNEKDDLRNTALFLRREIEMKPTPTKLLLGPRAGLLILLLSAMIPEFALAQTSGEAALASEDFSPRYSRRVGGLFFIPSGRIADPFVTTHVRTATGAGVASGYQAIFRDTDGNPQGKLEGDLAFVALDFEYQQNLFGWSSARLAIQGNARTGTSDQSLLATGLTAIYGLQFQAKAQIIRKQKWLLTGLLDLSGSNLFGISPYEFAKDVVDSGLTKENSLILESETFRATVGLGAAYAPAKWIGFTLIPNLGVAEPFDSKSVDKTVFRLEATSTVDFGQLSSIPIGLLLTFQHDSFPSAGADIVDDIQSYGFAIAYTGRDEFSISLESLNGTLKVEDAERNSLTKQLLLNIRYYF
jgi:hypothetical protein